MTEEKKDLELILVGSREEEDLAELKRQQLVDKVVELRSRLTEKIDAYTAEAPHDLKIIMALNNLLGREFSQHDRFSLRGYEELIKTMRDTSLLTNNNLIYQDEVVASEVAVYVVYEPGFVTEDDGEVSEEAMLSISDRINRATEIYDMDNIKYKLYVYINTSRYDVYKTMTSELQSTVSKKYTIISEIKDIAMREEAEVLIDKLPVVAVESLVTSFLTTLNLFSHRRSSVYFTSDMGPMKGMIREMDFLLLAQSYLPKLLVEPVMYQTLAAHYTSLWLGATKHLKFLHEEVEDFFQCPSTVLVTGLSPLYGLIIGRKVKVKGELLFKDGRPSKPVTVESDNHTDFEGLFNEDELAIYLKQDSKNIRINLLKYKDEVIRVEEISKTLVLQGKNINSKQRSSVYSLTDKFNNVIFVTPYYLKPSYNKLMTAKSARPYALPSRFKLYLLRRAYQNGGHVSDLEQYDVLWFSKNNLHLTGALEMLSSKFTLDNIIGTNITAMDGVVTPNFVVGMGDLKCLSKIN